MSDINSDINSSSLEDARRHTIDDRVRALAREYGMPAFYLEAIVKDERGAADERARVLPDGENAREAAMAWAAAHGGWHPHIWDSFEAGAAWEHGQQLQLVTNLTLALHEAQDALAAELPYDVHLAAAHWALAKALELYPPGEPTTPDPDEPLTYEDGAQSGYVAGYQAALAARVLGPAADRTRHSNAEWQEGGTTWVEAARPSM